MKKMVVLLGVVLLLMVASGCTQNYTWYGTEKVRYIVAVDDQRFDNVLILAEGPGWIKMLLIDGATVSVQGRTIIVAKRVQAKK